MSIQYLAEILRENNFVPPIELEPHTSQGSSHGVYIWVFSPKTALWEIGHSLSWMIELAAHNFSLTLDSAGRKSFDSLLTYQNLTQLINLLSPRMIFPFDQRSQFIPLADKTVLDFTTKTLSPRGPHHRFTHALNMRWNPHSDPGRIISSLNELIPQDLSKFRSILSSLIRRELNNIWVGFRGPGRDLLIPFFVEILGSAIYSPYDHKFSADFHDRFPMKGHVCIDIPTGELREEFPVWIGHYPKHLYRFNACVLDFTNSPCDVEFMVEGTRPLILSEQDKSALLNWILM